MTLQLHVRLLRHPVLKPTNVCAKMRFKLGQKKLRTVRLESPLRGCGDGEEKSLSPHPRSAPESLHVC